MRIGTPDHSSLSVRARNSAVGMRFKELKAVASVTVKSSVQVTCLDRARNPTASFQQDFITLPTKKNIKVTVWQGYALYSYNY